MTGTLSDRRLIPLANELAAGKFQALSVDIFDTLLWRRVPEPKDIFFLVGQALIKDGLLRESVSPVEFAQLRASGEKAARAAQEAQTGSREVSLADIYDALPHHIWWAEDAQPVAAAVEVDTEADAMVLDHDVAALMDHALESGVRVILTSDTYFTRQQLLRFLSTAGLDKDRVPDTLYISNEHGRPKWRDLFDTVLKELSLQPKSLVHLGDNADVAPCAARGISYLFYDKWTALPRTQQHELNRSGKKQSDWLNAGGEGGLTGLRSRLAHRAPKDIASDHVTYWSYGAVVLAPLFAAYGRWVVDTVAQAESGVVFGIMQEGRFLNRVVATVAERLGKPIQTKELWLSRRAVVRAALWSDDFSYLAQAITYCPGPTTDDILAQLGLFRSDLSETFIDPSKVDIHAPGGLEALLTAVSQSQTLQSKIAQESEKRRQALLDNLNQQAGLKEQGTLYVLDLGYAGTIQTALRRILERENVPVSLTGLYVALNEKGRENVRQGTDLRALFGGDGYDSPLVRELERTPDVLEHACMCEEGSLDFFEQGGQPVLLDSQREDGQIQQMEAMQDGIIAGVNAIMDLLGDRPASESAFVTHAGNIVLQAMLRPTVHEAETIGRWIHEANFDLEDKRALADLCMDANRLEYGDAAAWRAIQRHEAYWPAAALARIAPQLVEVTASLKDRDVPPGIVSSGSVLGNLVVTPDLGVGLDERRQLAVPLALSPLGRGELEFSVKPFGPEAFESLRIALPKAKAAFTVDNCSVVYRGDGQSTGADVTPEITIEGDVERNGGLSLTGTEGAGVLVSLAKSTPPWPHALDVRLRITYLRLDRVF